MNNNIHQKITEAIAEKPIGLCDLHKDLKDQGHSMNEICQAFSELLNQKKVGLSDKLITACSKDRTCRQLIILNN